MIVAGEAVARFVSEKLGASFCPPYTTLGIERDGQIVAGIILNSFEGPNCHVSVAGTGWTRAFLKAVGQYVFGQLGCIRFTLITEQPRVVQLAQKLGGEVEGVMRHHYGRGRDGVIVGILAEDYRFR